MIETVRIDGLAALANALKELPQAIATKHLRKATANMAALVRNEARVNAARGGASFPHVITGEMLRDIQMKRERASTPLDAIYSVFVRSGKKSRLSGKARDVNKDSFYWRFVEFGHWINPGHALGGGRGSADKDRKRAAAIAAGHNHFVTARPFMRPAFETKKLEAIEVLRAYLSTAIASEAEALKQ